MMTVTNLHCISVVVLVFAGKSAILTLCTLLFIFLPWGTDMIPAFIGSLGWPELLIIGLLGVLIFGRRLPEVGRNVGRGIVEFKRGLSGLDDTPAEPKPRLPEDQQSTEATAKSKQDARSSTEV